MPKGKQVSATAMVEPNVLELLKTVAYIEDTSVSAVLNDYIDIDDLKKRAFGSKRMDIVISATGLSPRSAAELLKELDKVKQ